MKQIIEINDIKQSKDEYQELEETIVKIITKELYLPLLEEFSLNKRALKNSLNDLVSAIMSGQINYYRGKFIGKWDSTTSRELRKLGAIWDRKQAAFKLPMDKIPMPLKNAIAQSQAYFEKKMEKVDKKLATILPKEIAEKIEFNKLFDSTIFKASSSFKKQMKSLVIEPKLTKERAEYIRQQYTENIKISIQDFLDSEIKKLREKMKESAFKGLRAESMVDHIRDSYQVTQSKAKLIARQETNHVIGIYKEAKYKDLGIKYYAWRSVTGTVDHPVRPRHQQLNDLSSKGLALLEKGKHTLEDLNKMGLIFRFDDPPIVSEPGQKVRKANPSFDFFCRCHARLLLDKQSVIKK